MIAVICGTPIPATIRVVQIEPGPIPTLTASTPALISAYEKTERNPSLERLIALADIYHTSTDYILGRTTTDSYATIIEVQDLTDAQIRILRELVEVMKHTDATRS